MTIKDQIEDLLADYRKDFYAKTGLMLVAFPNVGLPKIPLYELIKYTCYFYGVSEDILVTRGAKAVKVKDAVTGVAMKMGYMDAEIYKAFSLDRTTLPHTKNRFQAAIKESKTYRYEFYRLLEYLRENAGLEKVADNVNWRNPDEYVGTLFGEDIPQGSTTLKTEGKGVKHQHIKQFLKSNPGTTATVLMNTLFEMNLFPSREAVRSTLYDVKQKGEIKKEQGKYYLV